MRKRLLNRLISQKQLPYIGEFKETLAQAVFWGSIVNWIMVAGTFYYTTLRHVFPEYTIGWFILTGVLGIIVIFIIEYKYIVPSIWIFRNKQMKFNDTITNQGITVAVSGGFDPIHSGHIVHIEEAAKLGRVLVILTRDDQLIEKDRLAGNVKRRKPIPYQVRKATLEWGLGNRGAVVSNIDDDITSCESLRKYKPDIYAKGGNTWDIENLPEKEICEELGIEVVFGVGGRDKLYSSSQIMQGVNNDKRIDNTITNT